MPDPLDPSEPGAPDSRINGEHGRQYWAGINADVDGMLGGFSIVSKSDLHGSRAFLAKLGIGEKAGRRKVNAILEGGAGRVIFI
jgi:protein N-terminal methyltransferase